jgi:hypothetical protein
VGVTVGECVLPLPVGVTTVTVTVTVTVVIGVTGGRLSLTVVWRYASRLVRLVGRWWFGNLVGRKVVR